MSVLTRWTQTRDRRRRLKARRAAQVAYWSKQYHAAAPGSPQRTHAYLMLKERQTWLRSVTAKLAAAERIVKRHTVAPAWQGSSAVIEEVIAIVGARAPITSRKRASDDPLSVGNPGSDHSTAQKGSDAVDFGIANAHWLKNEISRTLGGPRELTDYGFFYVVRGGVKFRVQIIAGPHGTGPHLHVGVRRVGS